MRDRPRPHDRPSPRPPTERESRGGRGQEAASRISQTRRSPIRWKWAWTVAKSPTPASRAVATWIASSERSRVCATTSTLASQTDRRSSTSATPRNGAINASNSRRPLRSQAARTSELVAHLANRNWRRKTADSSGPWGNLVRAWVNSAQRTCEVTAVPPCRATAVQNPALATPCAKPGNNAVTTVLVSRLLVGQIDTQWPASGNVRSTVREQEDFMRRAVILPVTIVLGFLALLAVPARSGAQDATPATGPAATPAPPAASSPAWSTSAAVRCT